MSLTVTDLAAALPGAKVHGAGGEDRPIGGLAYDSRQVRPGDLFVCIKGFVHDGHDYAPEAAARGAAALMVERVLPLPLPQIVVTDCRRAMGPAAARLFGDPSRRLRVIGVTGTNGKTTTTFLIRAMMEAAGGRCGLIGTIEQSVGTRRLSATRTTPESADIQRLLAEMVANGCTAAAMEVSSHGLVLRRTEGTEFDVAVFTNITQDHFDFHRTFAEYREAKAMLFRSLVTSAGQQDGVKGNKCGVINADDPNAPYFVAATPVRVITYGLTEGCDVRAKEVQVTPDGVRYTLVSPMGERPVRLRLTGRFNVYNSLAAIAVGLNEGLDLDRVLAGIEETVVPGRFEPVSAGQDFSVIVDYAHTPDSLANVLQTARSLTRGRVICVIGAGGDRDRSKRPLMGEVAAQLADYVVVTSDNPRSEEPEAICRDVAEGVRRHATPYDIVVDRREGIRRAVGLARAGDLVLIAGKGHETYQEFRDRTVHFDDREEARKALQERGYA